MIFDVFECIQYQPLPIWTNLSSDNDTEGQGRHCAEYNGEKIASVWNMFSKLDKSSDQWLLCSYKGIFLNVLLEFGKYITPAIPPCALKLQNLVIQFKLQPLTLIAWGKLRSNSKATSTEFFKTVNKHF